MDDIGSFFGIAAIPVAIGLVLVGIGIGWAPSVAQEARRGPRIVTRLGWVVIAGGFLFSFLALSLTSSMDLRM